MAIAALLLKSLQCEADILKSQASQLDLCSVDLVAWPTAFWQNVVGPLQIAIQNMYC